MLGWAGLVCVYTVICVCVCRVRKGVCGGNCGISGGGEACVVVVVMCSLLMY